jgi:hypothetical protein
MVLQKMQTEKGVLDEVVSPPFGQDKLLDTAMDSPLIKVPPGQ